jgi:DNA-binding GntR family transcriptional regulator
MDASRSAEPPGPASSDGRGGESARNRVTRILREQLIIGRIQPGRPVTLRGLAAELGVSPMPVREAIQGLAAERALDVSPSGRVMVPRLDPSRAADILAARALLEPLAAERAAPGFDREATRELAAIDDAIDLSLDTGDVERYMRLNHAFHFAIYRRSGSDVFLPLIESVWLRFGPFMRMIYGRVGTIGLVDHHKQAIRAAETRDGTALAAAILADIREGMSLIGEALSDEAAGLEADTVRRRRRTAV